MIEPLVFAPANDVVEMFAKQKIIVHQKYSSPRSASVSTSIAGTVTTRRADGRGARAATSVSSAAHARRVKRPKLIMLNFRYSAASSSAFLVLIIGIEV